LQQAAAVRDDLSVLNALGEHFLRLDPRRAMQYFDRARSQDPLDKTAYDGLIATHTALGQEGEAEIWRERWREAYARKRKVDGRQDAYPAAAAASLRSAALAAEPQAVRQRKAI